jgi:aquaporin Z
MRAMNIRVVSGQGGFIQMKASFKKNWRHYLQEALGLAIFMMSACFFGSQLEANNSELHHTISNPFVRMVIMGIMMGATALFIFYSPVTSASGSHINPAVTLSFLRLAQVSTSDACFYILFQFIGGTIAVFIMRLIIGNNLIAFPVNSIATIPGKGGIVPAFFMEFTTAFLMMTMVLFTTSHPKLSRHTRLIASVMVCIYVVIAGPVSGFGMNPARTFASALASHTYTAFWIYMLVPVAGMLAATEVFLTYEKRKTVVKNQAIKEYNLH